MSSVGDIEPHSVVKRGNFNLSAERGSRETDGQIDVKVEFVSFENLMRLNFENHDKIARFAARRRGFAVSFFCDVTVRIRAGGNVERYRRGFTLITSSSARGTFFYDYLAGAAASVAGALLNGSENAVAGYVLYSTRTLTFFALLIRRAVLRARGSAIGARLFSVVSNGLRATFRGVEEGQLHFEIDILAVRTRGRSASAIRTRKRAENVAENVAETSETACARRAAPESAESAEITRPHSGMFEFHIVLLTFLRIG